MNISISDNGGKTIDRYTVCVVDGDHRHWYAMSKNPLHPNGFNQFCGEDKISKKELRHIGKSVEYYSLPLEVQKAIAERLPMDEEVKS